MNENDAMRLLAVTNPVRPEDLSGLPMPDAIFDRRPRSRLVLVAAVGAAAVAASLIGVFGFGGSSSHPAHNPGAPGSFGVVADPTPPQPIPLAGASAALGAPVILPDTPLLDASDVGQVTKDCAAAGEEETGCVVSIAFPTQRVSITYGRYGPPFTDPLPEYEATTADDTLPSRQFVYLGAVPGYLLPKGAESPGRASWIEFQLNETTIGISARNFDGAQVEQLAQSIVDQSTPTAPAHGQAPLADASQILGAPVVLPDTPLVDRSGAASTVWTACPAPGRPGAVCQVTVDFPSQALTIRYQRGVHDGKEGPSRSFVRDRFEAVVNHSRLGAELLDLTGTPALFMPSQSSAPQWIEFFVGNVDVRVQGRFDETSLQAIAQSILDRS